MITECIYAYWFTGHIPHEPRLAHFANSPPSVLEENYWVYMVQIIILS